MDDIFTKLVDLPTSIRAYTVRDKNDDFNIYINARLSSEQRMEAYEHEMRHIRRGDFRKAAKADMIEIFTHYESVDYVEM